MATTKSMTERELLTAIVEGKEITSEMQVKAQAMLTSLDKKIAKRKETGTKNQQENAEIKEKILVAIQSDSIVTIDDYITAKTTADYLEVSTQKASALLGQLVTAGELEMTEIKTKSGKVKGYKIPSES